MSNYKALAKHSGNYLIATLATKALSFISIPVYTYLLTVEEYGIVNVFLSTVSIATILLTLNSDVAISRYYYDASDETDFKRFVGTSVHLTGAIYILLSVVLILMVKPLSAYLDFEWLMTLAIIPVSLYNIVNSVFQQIYQPLLQSRKIAIVSSIQTYLAFALSVVAILLLEEKKYYGMVIGSIAAMFLIANYSIRQIRPYYINCFDKKYVKYILNYSLPYLPYSLSGIIIAQFGKLIIGQQQGFESAGLYSFASNIAMLMMVLITVTHSAWNPYYFTYMKSGDYRQLDNDYDLIWRITLVAALGLSIFGGDIGILLGNPAYAGGLYLIPIFVAGYCFYQWAYVYLRNTGYAKRTIWNAVSVVISGLSNVLLNHILLPIWGELGVAVAFLLSYLFLLIISWLVNYYILKQYAPKTINFVKPFVFYVFVLAIYYFAVMYITENVNLFIFKIAITIAVSIILFRGYIPKLWQYFNH